MKKASAMLTALLTSLLIGVSASAATPNATLSADGRMTITAPSAQPRAYVPRVREQALSEIYSTFNSDTTNLYDCCFGWTLSTGDSIVGARQSVAMPFTPAADATVREIELGLSYVTGANALYVSLRSDASGVPGNVIHYFMVTNVPPAGSCCETVAATPKGIPVMAGTTYWVVVKAKADTWGAWNVNTIGAEGPFAFTVGDGWMATSGTLGAFRVMGD